MYSSYVDTKQMEKKTEIWFEGNYIAIKYVGRRSMKDFIYEDWFKQLAKDVLNKKKP